MARFWCYNGTRTHNPLTNRPHREWCAQVAKGFRRKRRDNDPVAKVAGWGEFGFTTRPEQSQTVEVHVEGQPYHKSGRRSIAAAPKAGCKLASRSECKSHDRLAERLFEEQRRKGHKRFRARKGQKPRP